MMFVPRFVLFLIVFASLACFTVFADDEDSACEAEQAIIHNTTESQAIDAAIEDIASNKTGGCSNREGYYWCVGSLPAGDISALETKCTELNGTLIEISNARITCLPPDEPQKFTNIEMIPVCAGSSCDEDDVEDDFMDELQTNPDVAAVAGYCTIKDGGDFPYESGAVTPVGTFMALGVIGGVVLLLA